MRDQHVDGPAEELLPFASLTIATRARRYSAPGGGEARPAALEDQVDEGGWYTHLSIIGHVDEMRADTGLADIDRVAVRYTGKPYPRRDRGRISAWIAVDGWHGWGALKDSSQPG